MDAGGICRVASVACRHSLCVSAFPSRTNVPLFARRYAVAWWSMVGVRLLAAVIDQLRSRISHLAIKQGVPGARAAVFSHILPDRRRIDNAVRIAVADCVFRAWTRCKPAYASLPTTTTTTSRRPLFSCRAVAREWPIDLDGTQRPDTAPRVEADANRTGTDASRWGERPTMRRRIRRPTRRGSANPWYRLPRSRIFDGLFTCRCRAHV